MAKTNFFQVPISVYSFFHIHQNIHAKLQEWLPKLTRVRYASLKKSSFFFCRKKGKTKSVFFGLPLHLSQPSCGSMALCFIVSYVVNWVAGGCSFTFIVLQGLALI